MGNKHFQQVRVSNDNIALQLLDHLSPQEQDFLLRELVKIKIDSLVKGLTKESCEEEIEIAKSQIIRLQSMIEAPTKLPV
jgi:hypothetical protein